MASLFGVPIVPEVKKSNEPEVDQACKDGIEDVLRSIKIEEPTKVELQMAKHVRFKTPKKSTVMQKESVEYFVGSKAVDTLMSSKWSRSNKKTDPIFACREDAVAFMEKLLLSKMFYRVKKELKLSKEEQKALKEGAEDDGGKTKVKKRKKAKETKASDEKEAEQDGDEKSDDKESGEKKKKRRYKLEIHPEQFFLDSNDIYIWVYDPVHPRTWFLGGVVLLGVIAATLFPIWPPFVRVGVYYLSILGAVFVGSIFTIAVLRSCLFAVIWICTLGHHHLWLLPNLLADVGFFESFKPIYTHEYNGSDDKKKAGDKKGKKAAQATANKGEGDAAASLGAEDDDDCGDRDDNELTDNANDDDQPSQTNSEQCSDESDSDVEPKANEEHSSSDYEVIDNREG